MTKKQLIEIIESMVREVADAMGNDEKGHNTARAFVGVAIRAHRERIVHQATPSGHAMAQIID